MQLFIIEKKLVVTIFLFILVFFLLSPSHNVHAIAPDDTIYTVDQDGGSIVGPHTSIAIGSDGFPIIAYSDNTHRDLRVAHCKSKDCNSTAGYDINIVDSNDAVGFYTSIAIGSDGFPIISYFDSTSSDLKFVHCKDRVCSNATGYDITTIDSSGIVGMGTSIAKGSDDLPIISYYDYSNKSLKVAHCNDLECSNSTGSEIDFTTIIHPDSDEIGISNSIAVNNADGYPIISYYNSTDNSIEVLHCLDVACSLNEIFVVNESPGGDMGTNSSILIGWRNHPMIAYANKTNDNIAIAYCRDLNCKSIPEGGSGYLINNIDMVETLDTITLALTLEERAVVSYYDDDNDLFKVAYCSDAECNSSTIQSIPVDDSLDGGRYPSITVTTSGIPLVAYYDNQSVQVWYGRSWTPLLDMVIDLQHKSDESTNEIQVVTDSDLDGNFSTKNSSTTTGSGVTIGSDGIVNDLWLLDVYPITGTEPLYIKPKFYLSQASIENISYGDYREGNSLTFAEEFECGDLNNDDQVSGPDFSLFLNDYGSDGIGDFNKDSLVNGIDFAYFVNNYGKNGAYLTGLINHGVTDKSWVW